MRNKNKIGVVGVGKLGLAYALAFEKKGFKVYASSYKSDYVDLLKGKKYHTTEPGISDLLQKCKNIEFTIDNHFVIQQCDVIYVMVATPSTPAGDYDMSAIQQVCNDFISFPGSLQNKILIIGSTANPGTTDDIQKKLNHLGVHAVYCPTFVAQGSVLENIYDPHTLSIGTDNAEVFDFCKDIFSKIVKEDTPIYNVSARTGEILKLAGNCKATMEISFFNMMGQILLSQGLGKDLDTANQYLNFVKLNNRFKFGFGYGGPCYPRDNRAMIYFAQSQALDYPLGELIDRFNRSHIDFMAEYLLKCNKDNRPFFFEYLSYKPRVSIFEESQQLQVCYQLLSNGAKIQILKSEFLSSSIIEQLDKEFKNQVLFVDTIPTDGSVYKIPF